ncbi:MAG: 2-hydroxyacyl-CoA dehydratase family protein [Candidatus Limivicinus sp.]
MWKRKISIKEQYGTLGHFLKGDEPCHYLGQRYIEGTNILARREWRGVKDTAVAFYWWLKIWIRMSMLPMKLPIRVMKATFRYRWFSSFMLNAAMMDRWVEGERGIALDCDLYMVDKMTADVIDVMYKTFRADSNLSRDGKKNKYYDKTVIFDFSLPAHIMWGFPGYDALNLLQHLGYMLPLLRKSNGAYYTDKTISCGVPNDSCNLVMTEVGVALNDELPDIGNFYLSTNNPCDGTIMGNAFILRSMSKDSEKAGYSLTTPLRYDDISTRELTVHEIEGAIAFIEKQTGQKFNWDTFKRHLESTNILNVEEMERWDIYAASNCICVNPIIQNLYRMYVYQRGGTKLFRKASAKALRCCRRAVEKKIEPFPKARWRALAWSAEPIYYEGFSKWLYNCWGVMTVINMDSLTGHNVFDTSDKHELLSDLSDLYTHTIMRTHTVGGNRHLMQMWETAEKFNCNMILMYDDMSCKGMASAQGLIEEEINRHSDRYHVMWIPHSLADPRVVTATEIRRSANQYMTNVMHAEPLDPTLVDLDDSEGW